MAYPKKLFALTTPFKMVQHMGRGGGALFAGCAKDCPPPVETKTPDRVPVETAWPPWKPGLQSGPRGNHFDFRSDVETTIQ